LGRLLFTGGMVAITGVWATGLEVRA
jgi:hypothetical protein